MNAIPYSSIYDETILQLWNSSAVRQGFIPADKKLLDSMLLKHPYFSKAHAFLLKDNNEICGFICGCVGDDLPKGGERGYFTCLLLAEGAENATNAAVLLDALEESFRAKGKLYCVSNFFNPMHLPWIIPDTQFHQHNNAPGIATDLPLHSWMLNQGYSAAAQECAMYLDLAAFELPSSVRGRQEKAAAMGYAVDWYDKARHHGLSEMVADMGSPVWNKEIPDAAERINMLVAVRDGEVVGFAGPVYPEPSGRGYFAGIAVSPAHEGKGLGTLLFLRLCYEERQAGAQYMSLFTGSDNPALKIYENAGFTTKRRFSIMTKKI